MTQPTPLPTCPSCQAIRMPGAPMCTHCWAPFDEPAAAPVTSDPAVSTVAAAPVLDSRFSWNPQVGSTPAPTAAVIPTQGGPVVPPAGAPPGWRPIGTHAPVVRPHDTRKSLRIVGAVVVALLLLGVGGGYFWYRSTTTSDKELIADRFINGRPAGFIPSFSNFLTPRSSGLPESQGDAQRFLANLDPKVRKANDDIFALQKTLNRWGKGKVDDEAARIAINAFLVDLKPLDLLSAPESLSRGASKLEEAAHDYETSLNSLLDWIDSRNSGARTTYGLMVGDANVHWDEGLISLYRGSGLSQPPLPHPQVKE